MKKIAQIILAVVIVALVYVIYDQISTPIKFDDELKAKKAQVIDRIKDIRTAQRAFKSKYQRFTGSFDTLANFILQDTLELERKIVDEDDSVAMAQLKKMGKKNVEKFKIAKYGLTVAQITAAKRGEEIALPTGEVIPNAELTYRPYAPRSYAYLSDTNFSAKAATLAKQMREFARAQHIVHYYEVGRVGIEHALLPEQGIVAPGEVIIGADSHTCTYGALGAFSTGVGSTDMGAAMAVGQTWFKVPSAIKFVLKGKFGPRVSGKDLILHIIGMIGVDGALYKSMEFVGDGIANLSMDDRFTIANMAIEAGGKNGIFPVDEKAIAYMEEHSKRPYKVFEADPDAQYDAEYTFDLSKVRPVVAKPDFVDNVVPAEEACGIEINEAFLGSCNNGRIEDLRVGAEIIKGKKVSDKVRFLVVPASQTIYRQALKEGLIDIFMEAGAIVMNPNCSVCWGSCQGVIGENEVLISTGTRNFKGRAGHPSSKVYLGSAATVTASAIAGKIALPSEI